jgi:hypothetical protein
MGLSESDVEKMKEDKDVDGLIRALEYKNVWWRARFSWGDKG